MKINEKLLNRINEIQEQLGNVKEIDLNDLVDVQKAKDAVTKIKNSFTKMLEENPLYNKIMDLVTRFMDYDVMKDIQNWEDTLAERIKELNKEKCSCNECDCSENCCGYIDEEDNWVEVDDSSATLGEDNLTGKEIYDDWIFDDLHNSINLNNEKSYLNLIAEFMNKNYSELDRVEDDVVIETLVNTLYEFVNFTMNR